MEAVYVAVLQILLIVDGMNIKGNNVVNSFVCESACLCGCCSKIHNTSPQNNANI